MNTQYYPLPFLQPLLAAPLFYHNENISQIFAPNDFQRDLPFTVKKIASYHNRINCNLFPVTTLAQAALLFIETYNSEDTKRTYTFGFELFWDQKFLDPKMTLQDFCFCNRDDILDRIRSDLRNKDGGKAADATRQARAAQYVSFTGFLARGYHYIHAGMTLTKANICKQGYSKTFSHKRKETHATILTEEELDQFYDALSAISQTGYIIAIIQYHGARRVGEVAKIRIKDILFNLGAISIVPSKGGQIQKAKVLVYLPPWVMDLVKRNLEFWNFLSPCRNSDSFLFPDFKNHTTHISSTTIRSIYERAWEKAIPGFIPDSSTHCMRASRIHHLLEAGYRPDEIQKLTGHEDIKMVSYYGEKGRTANITKDWTQLDSIQKRRRKKADTF